MPCLNYDQNILKVITSIKLAVARQGEKQSESQCELRSRDESTGTTSTSENGCEPDSAVACIVVQHKSQEEGSAVACSEILVNKHKLTVT